MNLSKPLAAAVVAAFIAPAVTFAQTPADESSRLAAHLGLPDTATVTAAPLPGVPAASPLRVYLAFGMDMQVRDNFLGWIQKWNGKDAKKQGAIVVVSRLEDADLVFARFARRNEKSTHLGTNVRTVPTYGTATTNASASGTGTTNANAWSGGTYATGNSSSTSYAGGSATTTVRGTSVVSEQYTYETVPVFAYMLRPTKSGVEILWRYASDIPTDNVETKLSGWKLFDDFKKLAKERPRLQ